jgi:hypothetical protein
MRGLRNSLYFDTLSIVKEFQISLTRITNRQTLSFQSRFTESLPGVKHFFVTFGPVLLSNRGD